LCGVVGVIRDPFLAADRADDYASGSGPAILEDCRQRVAQSGLDRLAAMLRAHPFILTGSPYEVMNRVFTWERLLRHLNVPARDGFGNQLARYVTEDLTLLPNLVASAVNIWGIQPETPQPERDGGWEAVGERVDDRIGLALFDELAERFLNLGEDAIASADPHGLVAGLTAARHDG